MSATLLASEAGADMEPQQIVQWAREALMALVFIRREGSAGDYIPQLRKALHLVQGRFQSSRGEPFPPVAFTLAMDRVFPLEDPPAFSDLEAKADQVAEDLHSLIVAPGSVKPEMVSSLEVYFREVVMRAAV